jgi:hypothetical protein
MGRGEKAGLERRGEGKRRGWRDEGRGLPVGTQFAEGAGKQPAEQRRELTENTKHSDSKTEGYGI